MSSTEESFDKPRRYSQDPTQLLDVDVRYPGWEREIGSQKSYYVRGFTWFRDVVIGGRLSITDCGAFIPEMKDELDRRSGWLHLPFPWDEPFSPRQLIDAASPRRAVTPKFEKAAQIILLCEVIARAMKEIDSTRPPPEEVYARMRIEPAVSYIHGFDREIVERLSANDKAQLRLWTGQPSNQVFFDMADGHTVTHKLAERVRTFLTARHSDLAIGEADFRYSPRHRKRPTPEERIEVDATDLPADEVLYLPRRSHSPGPGRSAGKTLLFANNEPALRTRRGDGGIWMMTPEGEPSITAFSPEGSPTISVMWPWTEDEQPIVQYFQELESEAPSAVRKVSSFFDDHAVIEEVGGADSLDESVVSAAMLEEWRTGPSAVALEFSPNDRHHNSRPQTIWFSKFSTNFESSEAGISVGNRVLRASRRRVAALIGETHADQSYSASQRTNHAFEALTAFTDSANRD